MRSFTAAMVSVSVAATILSCSGGRGADGDNGSSCSVNRTGDDVVIECDDGTTETVSDGTDGTDGTEGATGKNGADGEDGATGNDGVGGIDGSSALVELLDEPAGANCPNGGTKVVAGLDLNANKSVDAVEVTSSRYICNGQPGAAGPAGTAGATGPMGATGKTSLVKTSTELAGSNCADGGIRIDVGLDDDADASLADPEIDRTSYLCQPQCILENAKLTIAASASGTLDYTSDTYGDTDNLLPATTSISDSVGWMGFDLASLTPANAVIGMRLYVRHQGQSEIAGDPTLRVVHGPAVAWTRTDLSVATMTRGKFVSALTDGFVADSWTEIPLDIDATSLANDRAAQRLSLGLDEVTTPTQGVAFHGIADAATRPYLEIETLRCLVPEQ